MLGGLEYFQQRIQKVAEQLVTTPTGSGRENLFRRKQKCDYLLFLSSNNFLAGTMVIFNSSSSFL